MHRTFAPIMTIFLVLGLLISVGSANAAAGKTIVSLDIKGNSRVDSSSIEAALGWKTGDPWNPDMATTGVKDVFDMGMFSRVGIDDRETDGGFAVKVTVREYPMIIGVSVTGSDALDQSELKKKLTLRSFGFYDPSRLKKNEKIIRDAYRDKGYFNAEVHGAVKESGKGVKITFSVKENHKTYVREIDILGNRALSDKEILSVVQAKELGPLSWISDSAVLNQALIDDDLKRIHLLYLEKGYLDIEVTGPEVRVHPEGGLYVSIRVSEGDRYNIGKLIFSGDWKGIPEFRRGEMEENSGDIFSRSALLGDIRMLENSYRDQGYAWAKIDPRMTKSTQKGIMDIDLRLSRGPLVRIRRINITGNVKTRDYVVRREVRLVEGKLFSQKKLDDSRRFIRALGFFGKMSITLKDVGDGEADVDIKLGETSSGTLSAGMAYSSVDGLVGTLQLAQGNFFGRGQQAKLNMEIGSNTNTYSVSFTEPRVFSGHYSLSLDLFNTSKDYTNYTQDSKGGGIRVGYRYSDFSSIQLSYRRAKYNVFNVGASASNLIREQEGESTTSAVAISYKYDSRDHPLNPHSGFYFRLSSEVAGGSLGGTNDFFRNRVQASYFKPIYGDLIGSVHTELGIINPYNGDTVPVSERFFMGGLNSLRGFHPRDVGPLDENGDPLGGNRSFLSNIEASYPLMPEAGIKGILFLDVGNVWGADEKPAVADLRADAGFGFHWTSPVGLLRLELGFNLDPRPGELQPGWQFSVGTLF